MVTPGALIPGVLVACVVWVLLDPGGRPVRAIAHILPAAAGRTGGIGVMPRWVSQWRARRRLAREPDMVGLVVAQVGALLRAGAHPAVAWERAAHVTAGADGVPDVGQLTRQVGSRETAVAVVAACRLAADIGSPLVGVLEQVAATIAAEADARAEREAALAGPRATTRVLMWLPIAGLLLGMLLGADPVATAFGGGLGTAGLVLGIVLLVAGHRWSARMVATARAEGELE